MTEGHHFDRRTVLEATGVALTTPILAGCMGDDGGDGGTTTDGTGTTDGTTGSTDETTTDGGGDAMEIRLGAKQSGWVGRAPSDIEGQTNPTLSLEADTKYTVTWENVDGLEHELLLVGAGDSEIKASDSSKEKGATVSLSFTATPEMQAYFCEYHPQSMRGQVDVRGGGSGGTGTTDGTGTTNETTEG